MIRIKKKLKTSLYICILLTVGLATGILTTSYLSKNGIKLMGNTSDNGYYNILDYGAQSDRPSFDNAVVINEIIQEMGTNGGTIYIPVGNFYTHSPITIDRSYVSIIGDNSGLRSGIDSGNDKTQAKGGGAKIIVSSGVSGIEIFDEDNTERISGITLKSFQIRGDNNDGIGIEGIDDSDRIVIDDMVITNVGTGIQLRGADAPSIRNSWIAETRTSIILNGASQQASIVNNSLGAQSGGLTIELENAQWFTISSNNIFPDGASNIRLYNPNLGTISGNTISSRYAGSIELLPNQNGEYGSGNNINGNNISQVEYRNHPENRDNKWGLIHIEANNTNISGNLLTVNNSPADFVGITIKFGSNNRISNTMINGTNSSRSKVLISELATNTFVTNSIASDESQNDGDDSNVVVPIPETK